MASDWPGQPHAGGAGDGAAPGPARGRGRGGRWADAVQPPWERAAGERPPASRPAAEDPLPPAPPPPRRPAARRRRVRAALAGALVLVFAALTAAGALLWYGRSSLEQDAIDGLTAKRDKRLVQLDGRDVEIMNVLVVGTDDPANLTPEQRAAVAPDERSGRRPDSLMLAQVEVGGRGAALLSLPRDLRVELCDGTTGKINAAYAAGQRVGKSPESCLVSTVTNISGIEIDHFVEVDFGGFLGVVDALGGVTMYFDEPMVDRKAHVDIPAGCVTLTPEQALGFVRSRGYDDDFGRIARQQHFIKEVMDEVARVGTLANPRRVVSLVDQGAKAVRTDDRLALGQMRDLALGLRNLTGSDVIAHTVPATPQTIGGISYVLADAGPAETLFRSFRDGSVLRPAAAEAPAAADAPDAEEAEPEPTLTPADLPPVVVLNGTGTAGLAAATAELLEARGFAVAEIGNVDGQAATTHIDHGAELTAEAGLLVELFGAAEAREDAEGTLTVVLGADLDLAAIEGGEADVGDGGPEDHAEDVDAPAQSDTASDVADADAEAVQEPAAGAERSYRGTERTRDRCSSASSEPRP